MVRRSEARVPERQGEALERGRRRTANRDGAPDVGREGGEARPGEEPVGRSALALRVAGGLLVSRDPAFLCGLLGLDPEPAPEGGRAPYEPRWAAGR